MNEPNVCEKINEILADVHVNGIGEWCKHHKTFARMIVSSLDSLNLEKNRHGRVQFRQAVWHYVTDTMHKPMCSVDGCTTPVKWNDTKHCYQQFCSNKCAHAHGLLHTKRAETMLQRYGVTNCFHNTDEMVRARLEKLGVAHAMQDPAIRASAKHTNIQRYGVDHPWKKHEIHSKSVANRNYCYIDQHVAEKLNDKHWMTQHLVDMCKTQYQVSQELGVAQSTVGLYASKHNITSSVRSKIQQQVASWLQDVVGDDIIINDKTYISPLELDIVIPQYNLAIEIDGVFWHGELNGKGRNYHKHKSIEANQRGFTLLHIYDTEWYSNNDIVKSRILAKLHKCKVIQARKCDVTQLTPCEYVPFINKTHIQGSVHGSVCYGLKHNGHLVAVMLLGRSRFDKHCEFELLRYSSDLNTVVAGGASKLFAHFVRHHTPTHVVSFCDLRWGDGKIYQTIGFEYAGYSPPNYEYFNRNTVGTDHKLYSRIKFQKHKLHKILPIYDPNISEWENMKANGYDRIWNCGNTKWIWKKPA